MMYSPNNHKNMNIYYRFWNDGILKARSRTGAFFWEFQFLVVISLLMGINIMMVEAVLCRNVFHIKSFSFEINYFGIKKIDGFINFFWKYMLLPLLINYSLIFHRRRYLKFLNKSYFRDGKLFFKGIIIMFFGPIVVLLLGGFIEWASKMV